MKKVKRFLTALLCVCVLAAVTTTAAAAQSIAQEAHIVLDDTPRIGRTAPKKADSLIVSEFVAKRVDWVGELDDGKFKANEKYTALITLVPRDENKTIDPNNFRAYVNNQLIKTANLVSDTEIVVPVEFAAITPVEKVEITLTAPVTGKIPAATAKIPSDAKYEVKKVEWKGTLSGGKFKEDTEYTANITLGIKSGTNAGFDDKDIPVYVNNQLIDEYTWNNGVEIMVPAVFSKTAAAATTPTELKEAKITLTPPETGKTPATTATVPSTASYTVKKVEWDGSLSGGKFKENTEYTAYVTLGIRSGKNAVFSDKVFDANVNGYIINEIRWVSSTEIIVPVVFEKTGAATSSPTVLKEAKITLTAPEAGKIPAATATVPSGASYIVKDVVWTKGDLSTGKFLANTAYTAEITLGIKSGKNAVFSDEVFDADVNGYIINEIKWVSSTEIIVPVEFEKTGTAQTEGTAITKIQLTIDAPGAGKKPAATASVPSTANSVVQSVKWSGQLDTDGTFMYRTKYTVTVTMGIKSGSNRYFSDKSINATVNGKTADEVRWYSKDKVEVIYTFAAFGTSSTIDQAIITMDGPAVGELPATTAHVPSTASTYVKSIRWEGALDSSGRFQAGTEYTAYITLAMKDNGRKFSEKSFDATVNGVLIEEVTRVSDTEIIIPVPFEKTPGTPSAGTIPASGTAYASTQMVDIDGKKVEFQMYALKDAAGNFTNYIKVRDLALALNGTKAQFSVDWNGTVNLVAGRPYTSNGSENSTPFRGDRAYNVPASATNVNGSASDLTAIVLTDDNGAGYTYYQLRDLGRKLGFNVSWSNEKGVYIESGKPYIG